MSLATLPALLLAAVLALFGTRPSEAIPRRIVELSLQHHADPALVAAICQRESQMGVARQPHLLCGAHVRLPADPNAPVQLGPNGRPLPRPFDRSVDAQVGYTARLFGNTTRCAWTPMLKGFRCGSDPDCRAGAGTAYAARILSIRDAIDGRMRAQLRAQQRNAPH